MQAITSKLSVVIVVSILLMSPLAAFSQNLSSDLRIVFSSEVRLLPFNDGLNVMPVCSPEGHYLAFRSDFGQHLVDANFRYVQTFDFPVPVWRSLSAQASMVAFVESNDGNRNVYVSNQDGTDRRQLTTHPAFDIEPALSPDGAQVVFASNRGEERNNYELYIVNTDGTNLTQLTNTGGSNHDARWSPDGSKIAFTSDRASSGHLNIYVMNADGSDPIPLTDHDSANYQPAFSPDGAQIAFVSDRAGSMDIYIMNADGSDVRRVTHEPYFEDEPCWLDLSGQ